MTVLPTIITKYAGIINDAVRHPPGPSEAAFRYLEAWQYYLSLPGFDCYTGGLISGIEVIMQGQFMFLLLNVVFLFALNRPQVAEVRCGYGGSNKAVSVERDSVWKEQLLEPLPLFE